MAGGSMLSRFRAVLQVGYGAAQPPPWAAAAEALQRFSTQVTASPPGEELCHRFATTLREALGVTGVALYVETDGAAGFALATVEGTIDAPERVQLGAALQAPAHVASSAHAGTPLTWEMYAPLHAHGTLLGIVALGPKRSRALIDQADTAVISMLTAQAAMALQSARYARELERQQAMVQDLHDRLAAETQPVRATICGAAGFSDIIGSSPALHQALGLVTRVAPTNAPVLVTGETGTGKELIARAIHTLSLRRDGPLVSVNCPAIPPSLAESELFGHERGAFTDAIEARPGKFELADGGTIFLDEVADLPAEMQVKLLRVLQEHETQRIGSRKVRKLDLRVVAATNRDLHAAMRGQRFRDDLYYRLAAVVVHVPALRERIADIPMLASHFLERACAAAQLEIHGFSRDALTLLQRHAWPGNVRELRHVVERAVLLCGGDIIRAEHLSLCDAEGRPPSFGSMIREEKQRRVVQALEETDGNQAAAARALGISRSNLGRLMKTLGMKTAPKRQ